MILPDDKFAALEAKLSDIQVQVEKGIIDPEHALGACRGARIELFALRQLLRDSLELEVVPSVTRS